MQLHISFTFSISLQYSRVGKKMDFKIGLGLKPKKKRKRKIDYYHLIQRDVIKTE